MPTAFPSRPWADAAVAVYHCIAPIQQQSQRAVSRPGQDTGLRSPSESTTSFQPPRSCCQIFRSSVGPVNWAKTGRPKDILLTASYTGPPHLSRLTSIPWSDPAPSTCALVDSVPIHNHLTCPCLPAALHKTDRQYVMANVPKPGPANLTPGAGLDEWLEEAKQCHYLPESVMKQLCEMVKEVLMEGSSALLTARRVVLTTRTRVQHTTNRDARHNLRGHTRPIL